MKRHYPHLLVLFVLAPLIYAGLPSAFQNLLTDFRFQLMPREPSGQVVLVAVDSPSLDQVGMWPWPRSLHATLIHQLRAAGVAEILFDIDFSARSTAASDAAFSEALRDAGGGVVLAVFKQATDGKGIHVNRPLPQFSEHAWPATVNITPESDGRIRRYAFGDEIDGVYVPSAASFLASGQFSKNAPPFFLDYSIRFAGIPVIPFADVLNHKVGMAALQGKKVIVGATAIELGDRYNVPIAGIVAGPKLHVLAAESILQGRTLSMTSSTVSLAGLFGLVMAMLVAWRRTSPRGRTLALLSLALAIEAAAIALQTHASIIVVTAGWHVAMLTYVLLVWWNELDLRTLVARLAQQRFQSIAIALNDGVICADGNGLVTFWNNGAQSIFGFTTKEAVGLPLAVFYRADDDEDFVLPVLDQQGATSERIIELVGVRKNGETFPLQVSLSTWGTGEDLQYGAVVRDISRQKRLQERMRYLAMHDSLTGLANRASLTETLTKMLSASPGTVGLVLIDLENFKGINDKLGQRGGDEVLRRVSNQLTELALPGAVVGRLAGDDFLIVLEGSDAALAAANVAKRVTDTIQHSPLVVDGRSVSLGASVGVAIAHSGQHSVDELLVNADLALDAAKESKSSYCVYTPSLRNAIEQRRTLEAELREAVDRKEFELFYQPQVRLSDKAVVGAEALIRWNHPTRGMLAPGQFLDVLEETPLANAVGAWVIESACAQAKLWQRQGKPLRIGVNISPSQFETELPGYVQLVLAKTGLPASLLELEITEKIFLDGGDATETLLDQIRDLGVSLAFDDFGTGYASLTHLKRSSLNRLKIDRSFVRDLATNSDSAAIVSAIAGLGKRLGLSIVAEGVEDVELLEPLREMGCDEAQGYLFGKPMPAAVFSRFLPNDQAASAA
jgi:diguanylate cyclase (GGDEF)-like protein/PAS domain S-box-containing protein